MKTKNRGLRDRMSNDQLMALKNELESPPFGPVKITLSIAETERIVTIVLRHIGDAFPYAIKNKSLIIGTAGEIRE